VSTLTLPLWLPILNPLHECLSCNARIIPTLDSGTESLLAALLEVPNCNLGKKGIFQSTNVSNYHKHTQPSLTSKPNRSVPNCSETASTTRLLD